MHIALLAKIIDGFISKDEKNYKMVFALMLNIFFSAIISALLSLVIAIILTIYDYNFSAEFLSYFFLFFILFILMIGTNLFANQINIPMIFSMLIFYLKDNFKSVTFIYWKIITYVFLLMGSTMGLFKIFSGIFIRYNVSDDISVLGSIILAIGITVAGFYAFPISKKNRDMNELLLSPIFILITIVSSYLVNEKNIIKNFEEGNIETSTYLMLIFVLATVTQIITYFKKLFEKLHDLAKYKKDIILQAESAEELIKLRWRKMDEAMRFFLVVLTELIYFLKENIKNKTIYLWLIVTAFVLYFCKYMINHPISSSKFSLPEPMNRIASMVIALIIIFFIMLKASLIFVSSFKTDFNGKKMRFDYLSIAIMCLAILFLVFSNYIPIISSFFEQLAMIAFGIGAIILLIYSIVEWLYKTQYKDD